MVVLTGAADTSTRKEHVESATKKAYSVLGIGTTQSYHSKIPSDCCAKAVVRAQVLQTVQNMMAPIVDNEEKSIIECGCVAAALLQQLLHHTDSCPNSLLAASLQDATRGTFVSIKQRKVAELASRVVLHTAVLACLDEEARLYPKLALVKKKAFIGARLVEVLPHQRHSLLKSCMSIIISVYKHPYYGVAVRTYLTGEVLTAALQLCFAPEHARDFPEDCGHFRLQLESAIACVEPTLSLRHFLLLRGIAASAQKSGWLLKVCTAMSVRRYLLREKQDGVRLIVRAGLDITDGDDWRQCEAVASLVARARVQDVDAFYRIIGPQVARILASKECQEVGGSVIRVMSMILSQLMQRSPSLTLEHVAKLLLHPLMELTVKKHPSSSGRDSGQNSSLGSRSLAEIVLAHSNSSVITGDIISNYSSVLQNSSFSKKTEQMKSDRSPDASNGVNSEQILKKTLPADTSIKSNESESSGSLECILPNHASINIYSTTESSSSSNSSDGLAACHLITSDSSCTTNSCTNDSSCTVNSCTDDSSCTVNSCTNDSSCTVNSCTDDNSCTANSCTDDNSCTANSCAADYSCVTDNSCNDSNAADSSGISSASSNSIVADSVSPVTSCSRSSSTHVRGDCSTSVTDTSDSGDEEEGENKEIHQSYGLPARGTSLWEEGGVGLERCVETLDRCIVRAGGGEGCSAVLTPALCPLFAVAAVLKPCRTVMPAVACIVKYLSNTSNSKCVEKLLVMAGLCHSEESPAVRDTVHLTIGHDGGLNILPENPDEYTSLATKHKDWFKNDQNVAEAIAYILQQLKNAAVVRKFFCELPKFLIFNSKATKVKQPNMLKTVEDEIMEELWELRKVVLVSELYGRLVEEANLLDSVFLSVSDAVPMILSLLRASAEPCDEDLESLQASVLLHVILMLCHFVCDPNQALSLTSSDWRELQSLLPVLKKLRGTRNEEAVREFIQQVENAISTQGVIVKPINQRRAKEAKEKLRNTNVSVKVATKEVPLIQEISSKEDKTDGNQSSAVKRCKREVKSCTLNETYGLSDDDIEKDEVLDDRLKSVYNPNAVNESCSSLSVVSSSSSTPFMSVNTKKSTLKHDYDSAMEDVYSPLVPVCGHALISLSKLIEAGDEKAKANEKKLLTLFEHNLKHDDSYVYLAAVEGLSVLCDAFPDEIVPVICSQISSDRSAVDRVKMTEVATRAARRLSSSLVTYKQHFFNSLIGGVRNRDAMVRAACLSSLGELCKELHLCMGPERIEVVSMAMCVMECDEDVEPRRAALLLVTLLFRGLGVDTIRVLKDVLKDLYKCLRLVAFQDKDEVTRTQASVAIEELNSITRAFMVPKLNNTKTIYVTEPPPKLV
ncbi:RNA polymerase II assembly factor Rtp1 C-terminal [Trinorchestia longiramus]|nr:RNA polymerase II assembly factor Rtp1 C-terminal [Trinorchestia longiramus]